MNNIAVAKPPWDTLDAQPSDVRDLSEAERDAIIINATKVDEKWITISRYGDNLWQLTGFTSNVPASHKHLNFNSIPHCFRSTMKAVIYRYLRRGLRNKCQPKGGILRALFNDSKPFLRHLESLKITKLNSVTPLICKTYEVTCKAHQQPGRKNKPLSQEALSKRFYAVEALYELSQYTEDPIPEDPWPESSAQLMAGLTGQLQGSKTPLIPDNVFCNIFERAYQQVKQGEKILDLQDSLKLIMTQRNTSPAYTISRKKSIHLRSLGWEGGLRTFNKALSDLRVACYIVIASTSGCRNHEIVNLQIGAHHRTQDDEGTVYHWMRSRSEKTSAGIHDWMIPDAAVRALRIMERWSSTYQANISAEISQRQRNNPHDPEIAEAQKYRRTLFLGAYPNMNNKVRPLSNTTWNIYLKEFARDCGESWNLTSHQFRRKFANYAAHSQFGDLRYLKAHFAHWSLDMTLMYAVDEDWGQHLELELATEIKDELEEIKFSVVDNWLKDTPLAGGYGRALQQWRRVPQNLSIFKDRASMLKAIAESTAIRSNGHAWCTADSNNCVGNSLERTRCGQCNNAVIGPVHAPIYKRLLDDLKELLDCPSIGESGRQRVERDLNRCRDVLIQMGIDPETLIA